MRNTPTPLPAIFIIMILLFPIPALVHAGPVMSSPPAAAMPAQSAGPIVSPQAEMKRGTGVPASQYLESLNPRRRENAVIEIELSGAALEGQEDLAVQARDQWAAGGHREAIDLLRKLESSGAAPAVGITWRSPLPGGGDRASDSRVGDPREGAYRMALDYHDSADRLFVLLLWDTGWTVNISHNGGDSWSETYSWYSANGCFDVDGVVADDYFYVGYVPYDTQNWGNLRRFNEADGSLDSTYGYDTVVSVSPNTIRDVALASNASGYDDDLYYVAALNIGEVEFVVGDSDTGDNWLNVETYMTDYVGGLDACVNAHPYYDNPMFSYISSEGKVKIMKWDSYWFELVVEHYYSGYILRPRTAVSAYENTTICAYGHAFDNGYGVRYGANLDDGFTFQRAALSEPAVGEHDSWLADVSVRDFAGVGAVYLKETGGGSADVWFRCLPGISVPPAGYGEWEDPVRVNEHDSDPTERPVISWIPPTPVGDPDAWAFGILYLTDDLDAVPYFDRKDGLPENGGDCSDPIAFTSSSLPFSDTNSTLGQGDDYFDTCMGSYDGGQDVIYKLTMYSGQWVKVTLDAATGWAGVAVFDGCPGDAGTSCIAQATSSANPDVIDKLWLDAGTYWIMVDSWPPPETFSYTLTVEPDPPGSDCTDPIAIDLPAQLPFRDAYSTCGHGNDYDATCMGTYDGGEEIIFELDVAASMCVDLSIDSYDGYTGFAVFESCPADDPESCIAVAGSSSDVNVIAGLQLDPGTYWVMVDSWPTPTCHQFLLEILACCDVACPPGATDEGEPCGEELNDGCLIDVPAFRPVANGETVCGTLTASDGYYGTDWLQVELDETASVTLDLESEWPVIVGLAELEPPGSGDCADWTGYVDPWDVVWPCSPESMTFDALSAGTHWLLVYPYFTHGNECGFRNTYAATVSWPTSAPTVDASFTCAPDSGIVPFQTLMTVALDNLYPLQIRRVAGRIDIELANGSSYPNWRAGYTNIQPGETFTTSWVQNIPALGSVVGNNTFGLLAEDVTPPPYNQPPYAPSGDTATDVCTVTAVAP